MTSFTSTDYGDLALLVKASEWLASSAAALILSWRGHVFPGGLSLIHDFRPSLTLGGEIFGAYTGNGDLGKSQFEAMAGGQYVIRKGLTFCLGVLGGKYVASPRLGGQIGFAIDFP